jgi:hypothetical protein
LDYDPLYEEPNYEELPAVIDNSLDTSGYSSTPNVQVDDPVNPGSSIDSETAYDLGTLISGITDTNALVLDGVCYPIARTEDDTTTIVITHNAIVTGSDRPKNWMIRPTAVSVSSDYTELGVDAGDTAIFEIISGSDTSEETAYVWGVREKVLAFDDVNIAAYLADSDVTVRLKSIRRRSALLVDDLVMNIPRLQEVIALDRVEDAPDPLAEEKDFRVQDHTTILNQEVRRIEFLEAWFDRVDNGFDGSYSALSEFTSASADFVSSLGEIGTDLTGYILVTPEGRFRLLEVVDANTLGLYDNSLEVGLTDKDWEVRQIVDPPDTLWAEITYLDNKDTIEGNFGSLIGFTLDDLEERTDNLDYLSAVQGLWYATWFGRTLENIRIGSQILLGLPFAEVSGTIIDIKSPHDDTRDRIIVQDDEDNATIRSYYYPTVVGIADNRDTGVSLTVDDHVDQFDPLSGGVQVDDWGSVENWAEDLIGTGDMTEVEKIHNFMVKVSADVFDITNLTFLISFLLRIKPRYTYPMFTVVKDLIDTVDVADSVAVGPIIPTEGEYPNTWPTFTPAIGWSTPAPSEQNAESLLLSPAQINRTTPPTYDITTRWPNDRFVTAVSQNPANPYGNLHLFDTPGRVPDGWEGSWNGLPSSHAASRAQGARKYDAYDQRGHVIHKYDGHLSPYVADLLAARDGHMEDASLSYWTQVGSPSTYAKDTSYKYSGSQSLHIVSSIAGEGGSNPFGASDSDSTPTIHTVPADPPSSDGGEPGYQVAVVGWIYIMSGQAVLRLRDQDGTTYVAEVRRNQPNFTWLQFVLHHWYFSGSASPLQFEALSGPAGADFYIDSVEAFVENVPWCQWGYDRSITGRTGGYTFGGDPDEFFQVSTHFLAT